MSEKKDASEKTETVRAEQNEDEMERRRGNLLFGGMIGVDLVVLQVFISQGVSDVASLVSVLAFAIGLPLLSASMYVFNDPKIKLDQLTIEKKWRGYFIAFCLMIGFVASIVGLSATFWHISWIACIVFLISGAIAVFLFFIGLTSIK